MWDMQSIYHEVGEYRHKGRKRHTNEDSTAALYVEDSYPHIGIYAVADGVGGALHGEAASKIATETILKTFVDHADEIDNSTPDYLRKMLLNAFHTANNKVVSFGRQHYAYEGMSTTLVAAVVVQQRVYLANVGDSRAYVMNDKQIRQVTKDHSFVQFLVDEGIITPEETRTHPRRHIITQAIGDDHAIEPDFYTFTLHYGDSLLLCSDGLSNELTDDEILQYTTHARTSQDACEELIERANILGGRDNMSAILVKMHAPVSNVF